MFAVSLILLVILVVAVTIVLIVALPQLRSGSEIFTEDGKQAVVRAGQVARTGPTAVVGSTKQLLRPVSQKLHAQLDRLDDRQGREESGFGTPPDDDHRHPADRYLIGYRPTGPGSTGNPGMVGQRPVPEESGPIPELPAAGARAGLGGGTRDAVPPRLDVVIDLRDTGRTDTGRTDTGRTDTGRTDTDPAETRPIDKPIEHRAGKPTT